MISGMGSDAGGWVEVLPKQRRGGVHRMPIAFVSLWAVRIGFGMMAIPKMPSVETNGRCEHWLQAMREWAMMAPMGIALGLVPPDPVEAGRVPRRLQLDDVIVDGELRHRLRRTKWDSPFRRGTTAPSMTGCRRSTSSI